ncbi:MAG: hypothetical protein ACXWP0_05100 [Ktedonobacterales bacterium]
MITPPQATNSPQPPQPTNHEPWSPASRHELQPHRAHEDGACVSWPGILCLAVVVLALSVIWWWSALPTVLSTMLSPLNIFSPAAAWQRPGVSPSDTAPIAPATLGGFPTQQACTGNSRDVVNASAVVGQDEWLCGDLRVYNGDATVVGRVGGAVTIVHGALAVSGEVDGNVTVLGGSLDLRPGARIGGGVNVVGGTLLRGDHTVVGGPVSTDNALQQEAMTNFFGFASTFSFPWSHLIFWVAVGGALVLLFPRQVALVHRSVRDDLPQSLGVGVVVALVGGVLAVVLTLTCIGIPLAVLLLAALWVAWVVGTVASGAWLGSRMLGVALPEYRTPLLATVLGVTVLSLVKAIPCVGGILSLVIGCVGLGASVLALLYARRSARLARWARRRDLISL